MKTHRGWLPRIILAALASLFLILALQPLIRRQVVRVAEQLTGSRLQPRRLVSSLADGQVIMTDILAVDPDRPERQLYSAEEMALQVDRRALAHGRIVIRRGHLTGLRLPTPDMDPGCPAADCPSEQACRSLSRWLRLLVQSDDDSEIEAGQLARLSQQLMEERPQHVRDVARRAAVVVQQVQQLQDSLDSVGENPLRNRAQYQQAVAEIDGLQREMSCVRRQLDQCRQQLQMDQEAVDEAHQQDLNATTIPAVAALITSQQITDYFLEAELHRRVQTALAWIRWGRQFFPSLYGEHQQTRRRGHDLRLIGSTLGDVTIDSLVLRGECEGSVAALQLEGTVSGLGTRSAASDQPTEIILQATGTSQTVIRVHAGSCDGQPMDRIVVSGPRWTAPESLWGPAEQLGMTASAGDCQYWLSLQHHQGQITGEMVIKRTNIALSPRFPADYHADEALTILTAALRDINSVDMTARLSGSWEHPTLDIRSSLGPRLVANVDQQVCERHSAHCKDVLAQLHRQTEAQLERVQTDLSRQYDELVQLLDAGAGKIDQLRATVAERVDQTDDMLETDSPLRETLRR